MHVARSNLGRHPTETPIFDEEDAESARVQLSAPPSAGELFHQGAQLCLNGDRTVLGGMWLRGTAHTFMKHTCSVPASTAAPTLPWECFSEEIGGISERKEDSYDQNRKYVSCNFGRGRTAHKPNHCRLTNSPPSVLCASATVSGSRIETRYTHRQVVVTHSIQ